MQVLRCSLVVATEGTLMLSSYEDLFALADRLGEKPRWFDENGVPRFVDHHPRHAADIYADEVALVLISCQRCGCEIPVQMSHSTGDDLRATLMGREPVTLAARVKDGTIHYGDPPVHNDDRPEYCHAGCTMSCWDLRVIEFWHRPDWDWVRDLALEIELPDAAAPERLESAR